MGLRSKMHHSARLVLGKQLPQQRRVANVSLHKTMQLIALQRLQIRQIPGVRQRIKVQDRLVIASTPLQNEVGADETGSACY